MERKNSANISLERFRAELEVFSGPLDLLLYLVKQQEVDIFEVPLSRVTDHYLAALRTMQLLDVNVASEFLVVAATLMEIKSKTLLPPGEAEEEEEESEPGVELIRRLLDYKQFNEAAEDLHERARRQGVRHARPRPQTEGSAQDDNAPGALLEDLAAWDLMAAFAELVEQTHLAGAATVVGGGVPVAAYIEEVLARLRASAEPVRFLDFFRSQRSRGRIVGVFLALLELVRREAIHVHENTGKDGRHIEISLRSSR